MGTSTSMGTSTAVRPKTTGSLRAPSGARHARMLGVGAYRPARVVPNSEVVTRIDSSDDWIRERSGIAERRWAGPQDSVVSMAETAARRAIEAAGLAATDIDAVLVATVTHPMHTPAAAPMVADRLGVRAAAFDLSAACAGYCYGISLANDMVRSGSARYVVVIGVERLTDLTDPYDRGTAFLFGDGAGAAVVGPSDAPGIGPTIWGSDGSQWEVIRQVPAWDEVGQPPDGSTRAAPVLRMAGQSVFRWAVWSMAPVAMRAIEAAGITPHDLDAFIPHQANLRIIDALVKQLKLPADIPVARDIVETANTSAASIPLATDRMLRDGSVPHGGLALQIGFGAGLVFAAQVVVLP